jgi:hypothetical protein
MARVQVAVQSANDNASPLTGAYTTLATGANNGAKISPHALVHVKNGTGGTATLTVITPAAPGGNAIADKTIAIPATSDRFLNLSDPVYKNGDGLVYVDSDVAVSIGTFTSPRG